MVFIFFVRFILSLSLRNSRRLPQNVMFLSITSFDVSDFLFVSLRFQHWANREHQQHRVCYYLFPSHISETIFMRFTQFEIDKNNFVIVCYFYQAGCTVCSARSSYLSSHFRRTLSRLRLTSVRRWFYHGDIKRSRAHAFFPLVSIIGLRSFKCTVIMAHKIITSSYYSIAWHLHLYICIKCKSAHIHPIHKHGQNELSSATEQ